MKIEIKSTAFENEAMIPSLYTCDDRDVSPPLEWQSVPEALTYALISDDPDAPNGTWVHWVIFNMPASVTSLAEGVPASETLPDGSRQGITDFRRIGYGGPCPPSGIHRYYFKIYALDTALDLQPGATKEDLLRAMSGHIIAEGQTMGRYTRK